MLEDSSHQTELDRNQLYKKKRLTTETDIQPTACIVQSTGLKPVLAFILFVF